jgi:guanylate kinase
LIVVISGPGGVGKGTVVARVMQLDPDLWLSRSWTTRQRRPGEAADAYTFVDHATFQKRVEEGGFLEHAGFLDNFYGTPYPEPDPGQDVVLEIDVQGAEQVREREPEALLIFIVAPSPDIQEQRLRGRGDTEEQVQKRLQVTRDEIAAGERLGATFVVNDDLDAAAHQILELIRTHRPAAPAPPER